ncbi:MAG TPA: hypothetical protein VEV17_16540 [Bryobacteraceae bacterium]|nr:hypothetical protein [Bryobacteraceae bacterium]
MRKKFDLPAATLMGAAFLSLMPRSRMLPAKNDFFGRLAFYGFLVKPLTLLPYKPAYWLF